MRTLPLGLAGLLLGAAAHAASPCEPLQRLHLHDGRITIAEHVDAGEVRRAASGGRPEGHLVMAAHCRVAGVLRPSAHSKVAFEVWLPESGWNGRYEASGNGGFAGRLNIEGLAGALARGSVGSTTDTGHVNAGEPLDQPMRWAYEPDRVADFGHRAIHATAVAAKAIIRGYYGQAQRKSYFASCSNGGRQALMEAQRYPDDYDGIIAGAPANAFTRLLSSGALSHGRLERQPQARLDAAQIPLIHRATVAACDARDGIADGLIDDPRRCDFQPSVLACPPGGGVPSCLNAAQVQTLDALYGRVDPSLPHFEPGTESDSWVDWIIGRESQAPWQLEFSLRFFRDMLHRDPHWSLRDFDPKTDPALAARQLGPALDSVNPDLSRFAARGGKLIVYHGWADAAIPAGESIRYFDAVGQTMGNDRRDAFARLYLVPGMTHCAGGEGFTEFGQFESAAGEPKNADIRGALHAWVEDGQAPAALIAHRAMGTSGVTSRAGSGVAAGAAAGVNAGGTRPLCPYPTTAIWRGQGSTEDAAQFDCALR